MGGEWKIKSTLSQEPRTVMRLNLRNSQFDSVQFGGRNMHNSKSSVWEENGKSSQP